MNMKRILKVIIVLICVVALFAAFASPFSAAAASGALVSGSAAVASLLIALGIVPETADSDGWFAGIVDRYTQKLQLAGFLTNLGKLGVHVDENGNTYVPVTIADVVKCWLFEDEVYDVPTSEIAVYDTNGNPVFITVLGDDASYVGTWSVPVSIGTLYPYGSSCMVGDYLYSMGSSIYVTLNGSSVFALNNYGAFGCARVFCYYDGRVTSNGYSYTPGYYIGAYNSSNGQVACNVTSASWCVTSYGFDGAPFVTSPGYAVTADVPLSADDVLANVYPGWFGNALERDNVEYIPLTIPSDIASASDLTQTGAQAGTGTQTGVIETTEDLAHYQMDLTQVFPFCIPFDLVAFFRLLQAEREAPYIELPFPIPDSVGGGSYNFVLDMAQFETVATVLRTMELLLFCVGLVLLTRKILRA